MLKKHITLCFLKRSSPHFASIANIGEWINFNSAWNHQKTIFFWWFQEDGSLLIRLTSLKSRDKIWRRSFKTRIKHLWLCQGCFPGTLCNFSGLVLWRRTKTNGFHICISPVIKQKGESQSECSKKTKHTKFSEKRKFLTPWYAHVRFEIRPFALLSWI